MKTYTYVDHSKSFERYQSAVLAQPIGQQF